MRVISTIFAILLVTVSTLAQDSILSKEAGIERLSQLKSGAGGYTHKVHFLGVDKNGRLCEVLLVDSTLGWAFDKAPSGTPQYIDNYLHLDTSDIVFKSGAPKNKIIFDDTLRKMSVDLEINPTVIGRFYDGDFVVSSETRTLECRLQQLINDDTTSSTGIILRTGIHN